MSGPEINCVCRNFMPIRAYNHTDKVWWLSCQMCGRSAEGRDKEETLKNWARVQKDKKPHKLKPLKEESNA